MLEVRVGIEPTNKGFADPGLTTWLPHRYGLPATAPACPPSIPPEPKEPPGAAHKNTVLLDGTPSVSLFSRLCHSRLPRARLCSGCDRSAGSYCWKSPAGSDGLREIRCSSRLHRQSPCRLRRASSDSASPANPDSAFGERRRSGFALCRQGRRLPAWP